VRCLVGCGAKNSGRDANEVGAYHGQVSVDDAEAGLESCPEEAHWQSEGGVGEGDYLEGFDADYAYDCDAKIVSIG